MNSSCQILVFARYPRLGEVKSRLAQDLGDHPALKLYRCMLLDSLTRFATLEGRRTLFWEGCSRREGKIFLEREQLHPFFDCRLQSRGDLGKRMLAGAQQVDDGTGPLLFLGTDTPNLPQSFLLRALEILRESPVTVGPAEDGGYYLLGMDRLYGKLFEEVDWGGPDVLQQTLAKPIAERAVLLPSWYDIDFKSDLRRIVEDPKAREEAPHTYKQAVGYLGGD